jgi:hypothetical protein
MSALKAPIPNLTNRGEVAKRTANAALRRLCRNPTSFAAATLASNARSSSMKKLGMSNTP